MAALLKCNNDNSVDKPSYGDGRFKTVIRWFTVQSESMVAASPLPSGRRLAGLPRQLKLPSWPWRITWTYLGFVLFLPLGTMLLKGSAVGPAAFWQMATTP
jgi:hypothetical protein